ncbi:hypothetical protein EZV62_026711 [Acer yangbiense]|uniref:ADP/ATP translocase n=1 Tax=Acer yangbiense TaxID=1000413 RepID=A0A5C7GSG9_9ROSI|nr:hypothetical protein EZV62_026711 [Acer yangbiense]
MTTETSGATSTSNSTSNLHQPSQGNAFVRSPSKGHDQNVAFTHLLFPVTIMAVLKTATAPLQRVNFLIQSQNEMIKSGRLSHAYKGIGDCFARTVRNEGFISLWRGNTASVLHFASGMVQRTMMDSFRINSAFCRKKDNDGLEEWIARNFATMALFGGTSILLVYHLEYARTRMANDIKINTSTNGVNKRQFDGLIDVYRKTLKSDGITGLFRGFNISCLEFFVNKKLMLGMNSVLNPNMLGLQQSRATTVILTGGVGICCDLATYPIDTSRLGPPHQGSASPTVTPMSSKSVGVTSKKGNTSNPILKRLFWVSSLMTTAPVNRVMVLMRCQNEMIKSGRLSYPYKGIADCFARTVRNEGIISMWKSNTSHMIGFMTMKFMHGSVRDNCSTLFNYKREDSIGKQLGLLLAANSLSRAATLVLIHPFEYAKTRMANDITTKSNIEKRQFNGIIDVFRKTLKSNGIAGLYRGYIMANIAYLVNDVLVFVLEPKQLHKELGLQNSMLVGAMLITVVDLFVNLITYPMHTVVQRMMMRSGEAVKYKSSSDALLQILINEGVRSLYKGASARITICAVTMVSLCYI